MSSVKQLSARTLQNYKYSIKRLTDAKLTLTDYDAVYTWLKGLKSGPQTVKAFCVALHNYFKDSNAELAKKYSAIFKIINDDLAVKTFDQVLTEKEKKVYLTYPEIQECFNRAVHRSDISFEELLLLGLYTQMSPVRSDYCQLRIYDHNDKPDMTKNHIEIISVKDDYTVIIRIAEHKTASSYGILERTVPSHLHGILFETMTKDIALARYEERPYNNILFNFESQHITKVLQRIFNKLVGKKVSVNIIRHAYITFHERGKPSLIDKDKEAREMGHSIMTHETYRRLDGE